MHPHTHDHKGYKNNFTAPPPSFIYFHLFFSFFPLVLSRFFFSFLSFLFFSYFLLSLFTSFSFSLSFNNLQKKRNLDLFHKEKVYLWSLSPIDLDLVCIGCLRFILWWWFWFRLRYELWGFDEFVFYELWLCVCVSSLCAGMFAGFWGLMCGTDLCGLCCCGFGTGTFYRIWFWNSQDYDSKLVMESHGFGLLVILSCNDEKVLRIVWLFVLADFCICL